MYTATSACRCSAVLDLTARMPAPELVEHYKRKGYWTDDTFGSTVDDALRRCAAHDFCVWSRDHPYRGQVGDVAELARRFAGGLHAHGIGPGDVLAFQIPNWVEAAV